MSGPKGDQEREPAAAETEGKKKPYRKPEFVREQLFETMALACGKTNPVIGQCKAVRKNS
jgi:hypothetical protein